MVHIFELLIAGLELLAWLPWPKPPPKIKPDDWTPPDAPEIARIVGQTPESRDDGPVETGIVLPSQPEGGRAEGLLLLPAGSLDPLWDRELDG